jgi:FAD/FMN-containing dehydrogenase
VLAAVIWEGDTSLRIGTGFHPKLPSLLFGIWEPHLACAAYVNDLGEEGEDRARSAYGDNYPRLAALKGQYDPRNLFRLNQNIQPM